MLRRTYRLFLLCCCLIGHSAYAALVSDSGMIFTTSNRSPLGSNTILVRADFNPVLGEFAVCAFSIDPTVSQQVLDCDRRDVDNNPVLTFQVPVDQILGTLMDMEFNDDGSIYVATTNFFAGANITVLALDGTGASLISPFTTGVPGQSDGLALVLVDNIFWLVHSSNGFIVVERRNGSDGTLLGPVTTIATGDVCGVTAAANSSDDVAITWVERDAGTSNCAGTIKAQVFRDNVVPLSDVINVSNTTSSGTVGNRDPDISASDNGQFTVVWFDAVGNTLTSRFDFNANLTLFAATLFPAATFAPRVAAESSSDSFVTLNAFITQQNTCDLSGRLVLDGGLDPNVTFNIGQCGISYDASFLNNDFMLAARVVPIPQTPTQYQVGYNLFGLPAEISLDGLALDEGNPQLGQGPIAVADVTLTRPHPSGDQIEVSYFTRNGTALAGSDYAEVAGTITFPAGSAQLGQSIQIPIIPDNTYEEDEVFTINLSSAINAVIRADNDVANIIILNDDAAPDLINNCQAGATECQTIAEPLPGNLTSLEVIFTIPEPQVRDITFNYTTVDGTAVAGSDYVANSGNAQIVAGTTQTSILLTVLGDDLTEDTETFDLVLSGSSSVTISQPVLTFAITDDVLCFVEVDPLGHNVPLTGGSRSFNINTPVDCDWNAISMVPWASITSAASGTGPGTVDYQVDARADGQVPTRFGDIVISTTMPVASVTHTIEQDGDPNLCMFTTDPLTTDFAAQGGSASVQISTIVECGWEAFSDDDWLTINAPQTPIMGNGTLSFSVEPSVAGPNVTTADRQSILDAPFDFTVTQSGCSFSLPVTSIEVAAAGDDLVSAMIFAPSSDPGPCPWSAVSNAPWILVTQGTAGTGGGEVVMDVLENPSVQPRTGTVQIGDDIFTVNQAGQPCDYSLAPTQVAVCPDGGMFAVNVTATAGCSWELSPAQSWLQSIANGNGIGNEIASIMASPNLSETPRNSALDLQLPGNGATQASIQFVQDGYLVYESFDVTRPSDWNYSPDANWSVQNGRLIGSLAGTGSGAAIDQSINGACSDCEVEATVSLLTPGSSDTTVLTLVGWYEDDNNFVGLAMNEFANRWRLLQMAAGNLSMAEVSVAQIIPNQDYALAIRFDGQQFSGYVNGQNLVQLPVQPGSNPSGFAGLLADGQNVTMDQLRLTGSMENFEVLLEDSFETAIPQSISMCTQ